jgi:hypothetical protein
MVLMLLLSLLLVVPSPLKLMRRILPIRLVLRSSMLLMVPLLPKRGMTSVPRGAGPKCCTRRRSLHGGTVDAAASALAWNTVQKRSRAWEQRTLFGRNMNKRRIQWTAVKMAWDASTGEIR